MGKDLDIPPVVAQTLWDFVVVLVDFNRAGRRHLYHSLLLMILLVSLCEINNMKFIGAFLDFYFLYSFILSYYESSAKSVGFGVLSYLVLYLVLCLDKGPFDGCQRLTVLRRAMPCTPWG